jgi:hypothetical protein
VSTLILTGLLILGRRSPNFSSDEPYWPMRAPSDMQRQSSNRKQQIRSDWAAFWIANSAFLGRHTVALNYPVKCVTDESLNILNIGFSASEMLDTHTAFFVGRHTCMSICIIHHVSWRSKLAQAVMLLTCNWEVSSSNLSRDTDIK